MSYSRVIPRDLFNESKLLKCLGQVALILHDYEGRYPVALDHTDEDQGFVIDQNESTGDLYCTNLRLIRHNGEEITLSSQYNSKSTYPLWFEANDGQDCGEVFDDNGQFTREFVAATKLTKAVRIE